MKQRLPEQCARSGEIRLFDSRPSRSAIHTSTGYICSSPAEADAKLSGGTPGYVYLRDGQPNADALAEKCRQLHGADAAVVTASGMSAMALAIVTQLEPGDHVLLSDRLYGLTGFLVQDELARWGITSEVVNMLETSFAETATSSTRMLIAETISNPRLRVSNIEELAEISAKLDSILLIDNTFATPIVCRPLEHGADLVVESITKMMNGHGDVTMGLLCGKSQLWARVPQALKTWGMISGPFDCWLAERGLLTLNVRMKAACANASLLAEKLSTHSGVQEVDYPGLPSHPDHETAKRLFAGQAEPMFGNMLTFRLPGGLSAANQFIEGVDAIEFVPSLGETSTTLSHPASTSHRGLSKDRLKDLGIDGGTIRLSIGLESAGFLEEAIMNALAGMDS